MTDCEKLLASFEAAWGRWLFIATRNGFDGFGGNCPLAAVAINDVVLAKNGTIVEFYNSMFFKEIGKKHGHVGVRLNPFNAYIDGSEGLKDEDDMCGWGILPFDEPAYHQELRNGGILVYDEREFEIVKVKITTDNDLIGDDNARVEKVREMERIIKDAYKELSTEDMVAIQKMQNALRETKDETSIVILKRPKDDVLSSYESAMGAENDFADAIVCGFNDMNEKQGEAIRWSTDEAIDVTKAIFGSNEIVGLDIAYEQLKSKAEAGTLTFDLARRMGYYLTCIDLAAQDHERTGEANAPKDYWDDPDVDLEPWKKPAA